MTHDCGLFDCFVLTTIDKMITLFPSTGTIMGMVNATDRDQKGTDHVKIRYSLLSELDRFAINPTTGVITTATNTLDREVRTCGALSAI